MIPISDVQLRKHQRKKTTEFQKITHLKIKGFHLSQYNLVFLPGAPAVLRVLAKTHLPVLCMHGVPDELPNGLPWKPNTQNSLWPLDRIPFLPAPSK